jgi:hypothetical protein
MIADGFARYCDVGRSPRMIADGLLCYCDFESGLRMIFALLRLGKSLADTLVRYCDS